MTFLFNEILYKPIFNLLVLLHNILPGDDFGVAIILLTLIVRTVFMPLSIKAFSSQKRLTELQPKIKEVQEKLKKDKSAQSMAIMDIYKKEGINPMSGCLPLLIQIPVLFALYRALINGLNPESLDGLYSFVKNPGGINNIFLGFINLSVKNPVLAVLAGAFQFVQSKIQKLNQPSLKGGSMESNMAALNKQMLYFFPLMIIIIAWNLPAGLVLYWVATTIFSVFEQLYIRNKFKNGKREDQRNFNKRNEKHFK